MKKLYASIVLVVAFVHMLLGFAWMYTPFTEDPMFTPFVSNCIMYIFVIWLLVVFFGILFGLRKQLPISLAIVALIAEVLLLVALTAPNSFLKNVLYTAPPCIILICAGVVLSMEMRKHAKKEAPVLA